MIWLAKCKKLCKKLWVGVAPELPRRNTLEIFTGYIIHFHWLRHQISNGHWKYIGNFQEIFTSFIIKFPIYRWMIDIYHVIKFPMDGGNFYWSC